MSCDSGGRHPVYSVTLDRARQWPGSPARLVVSMKFLGAKVERPIEFRGGIIVSEMFRAIDINPAAGTALYAYEGLRRPDPLMSDRERKLNPNRFPA